MNIKDKIEKNPIISLIVLSFILVSGATAVMQYFHSKEISIMERTHSLEISELRIKLSSIRRAIGDSEYFDVSKLFITKEKLMNIPPNLKYFESDQFYALDRTSNLIYKKYTYPELLKFVEGIEATDIYQDLYEDRYVHVWTTDEEVRIEGVEGLNLISPKMTIQKILKDDLRGILGALYHKLNLQTIIRNYIEKNELNDGNIDTLSVEKSLEKIFRGNWGAILIELYLTTVLTTPALNSNVEYELLNIRNFGNLLYVQGLTTLTNVMVNEEIFEKYYLRDEFICTSNFKQVYLISTLIPSTEPATRSIYFEEVTEWLTNLKIIIDK